MTDEILTADEAADRLKLTNKTRNKTIIRMARLGRIRGQKVGKEWRFHAQAIQDFFQLCHPKKV